MNLNLAISFLAGLATFFSPCILPVIPGYLAILSAGRPEKLLRRVIIFTLGLALAFTMLGALIGWVGATMVPLRDDLIKILGVVMILLGINLIRPLPLPFLQRDWQARISGSSDWSAFLLGGAFGVAWTPCSGVILGAIVAQALLLQTSAIPLLTAYSLGLIVPMIGLALVFQKRGQVIKLPSWVGRYFAPALGVVVALLGLALLTGYIDTLRSLLLSATPDLEKGLLPFTR